ncbi:MAG: metallophosphoesterase family protein [Haloferacaceae archaeon]
MRLGLVSDTHDDIDAARAAADHLASESVDAVAHLGDVVAPFTLAPFESLDAPVHHVRGNNEGESALWRAVDALEPGTHHGDAAALDLGGRSVALYHGTSGLLVDALVDAGTYDYVCHGHTHEHGVEERGGTVRVNPGGLPIPGADDAFHAAVLDLNAAVSEAAVAFAEL